MIKIEYLKAIQRPFINVKKLSIGLILLLIPILNIITSFVVKGFQLECAKNIKKYELPDWNGFKKFFIIGVLSFLISVIYLLPSLIVIFFSIKDSLLDILKSSDLSIEALTNALIGINLTGMIIGGSLLILTAYFIPIALLEFLNKYHFKDGFKINIILKKAFKWKYLGLILFIVLYYIILYLVYDLLMTLFALIPIALIVQIISLILTSIISFAFGVTAFTLLGEIYPKLK